VCGCGVEREIRSISQQRQFPELVASSLRRFTASGLPWIHLISISTPGGLAGPANPLLPTRFHAKLSLASAKLKFTGRSRKATKGMMGGAELRH
jgi:hypothetical protein